MTKFNLFSVILGINSIPTIVQPATKINNNLEIPIPTTFMNLKVVNNEIYFYGLVDYGMLPDINGYNLITITNNINVIQSINSSLKDKRLNVITKINYQEDSNLKRIASCAISCLVNLSTIIFPWSLGYIGKDAIVCCPNLKTLDFTAIEKDKSFMSPIIFEKSFKSDISTTGTIYVKNEDIRKSVEIKFHEDELFAQWKVVVK